jgi:hypothetical protein
MVSQPGYGAVPPGSGTVIIGTPNATATYTASSVTVTPKTFANVTTGSGLTYTTGTGIGYNPVEATWSAGSNSTRLTAGELHVVGDDADVIINGKSLGDALKSIEERLGWMTPNPELEKEWNELKQLGDAYRKLETDLKEKSKMWKVLNKV